MPVIIIQFKLCNVLVIPVTIILQRILDIYRALKLSPASPDALCLREADRASARLRDGRRRASREVGPPSDTLGTRLSMISRFYSS